MNNPIVRLQNIEIYNLKNVGQGAIRFSCNMKGDMFVPGSDILGIYGQNGSGKTALVNAIMLLRGLVTGRSLGKNVVNYIKCGTETIRCLFEFSMVDPQAKQWKVTYEFTISKKEKQETDLLSASEDLENESVERSVFVSAEKLSVTQRDGGKWKKSFPIIKYEALTGITPQARVTELTNGRKQNEYQLNLAILMAQRSSKSVLFSKDFIDIISDSKLAKEYQQIFLMLRDYAAYHLDIVSNTQSGMIRANIGLPFSFPIVENNNTRMVNGQLHLNEVNRLKKEYFEKILDIMKRLNLVLKEIIPGLTISLSAHGTEWTKQNDEIVLTQLMAKRGEAEFPLKYESDGIKKIISILNGIVAIINDPSATLVVDELDSGVFEYLLGELLTMVAEFGKGQLIFTSHNLRPLEVLHKNSIMFTTANESNRYIRLRSSKNSRNLRDLYFHDIVLGGQPEEIYEMTDTALIRRAFRLAGDDNG